MRLLSLEGVEVEKGGRTLLALPRLSVEEREVLVVLGPTGAGKSTLLRVLHFLERPRRGQLAWRGTGVAWPAPLALRRKIAMAFQEPLLLSGTTYDNVAYGLHLRGENGRLGRPRVEEALRLFHIEKLARQKASTLSGGEAQRTALARALVLRPELLLLDEPFASLDAPIRKHLLEELLQAVRTQGITCVYVTHEQSEAFSIADRIAVLHGGRLLQAGTPEEVLYRPRTRTVATFMQTGNILPGRVAGADGGLVRLAVGSRTVLAQGSAEPGAGVLACVRPEEVLLHRAREGASTGRQNVLEGHVTALVDLGATLQVRIACGLGDEPLLALVTRRAAHDLALRPGDPVVASFRASTVHLIDPEGDESDDRS